jgi:hypothetical protein
VDFALLYVFQAEICSFTFFDQTNRVLVYFGQNYKIDVAVGRQVELARHQSKAYIFHQTVRLSVGQSG